MVDIKEIKKLSVGGRILMVEEIWDSIAEDTTSEKIEHPGRRKTRNYQATRGFQIEKAENVLLGRGENVPKNLEYVLE